MTRRHPIRTTCAAAAVLIAAPAAHAVILNIAITGTVESTDLTRGPFADAQVGDPVSITFNIDTDVNIGAGEFHRYWAPDYVISVDGVEMTPSAQVTFGFTAFSTFHGFDNTSTGLLLPGGGQTHNYRLPVFAATGPPTIWPPQGSEPQQHLGFYPASLFDWFGDNAVTDMDAGGPGVTQTLVIAMDGIELDGPCVEDINGDGVVNVLDLLEVLAAWGNAGGPADVNGDGIVDVLDLLAVLAAWGPC